MSEQKACHVRVKRFFIRALVIAVAIIVLWALIGMASQMYEFWDDDPQRGAMILKTDPMGDEVSEIRYLDQGWDAADSLWFYNTTQGSDLLPYDFSSCWNKLIILSYFAPQRT